MSSNDLILRFARRVSPDDADSLAAQLRESPTFAGDMSWLGRVFAVADDLPMPKVPESLSAALVDIARRREFDADLEVELAVLIHDSRHSGELAGVRGTATATEAWTMIFSAPNAELIVDGTPEVTGETTIRGHILRRSGESGSCRILDDSGQFKVSSDASGKFELGTLGPGHYELEVRTDELRFSWALDI